MVDGYIRSAQSFLTLLPPIDRRLIVML